MTSPISLVAGLCYHIYNRGTNRENIFLEKRNYAYFLQLYVKHIEPVAETYAYCLLRNHFHVFARIRDGVDPKGLQRPLGSTAFSNFFNAYAKAINKAYGRTGSLFQHPFGRVPVLTQAHLTRLVCYIHFNPQRHGLISDFREWPYSSYRAHLSNEATRLDRETVLGWFDGPAGFAATHEMTIDEHALAPLVPEDFD
jgi:putative transposase